MDELTREIYGNIGTASKVVFYACALVSLAIFFWGIGQRRRLWRLGKDEGERIDWKRSLQRLGCKILSQRTVRRTKRKAGRYHALLFYAFSLLLVGTCLIAAEEWGAILYSNGTDSALFHHGVYFIVYEVVLEVAGLVFIASCLWFLLRLQQNGKADQVAYRSTDRLVLLTLLLIGLTGFTAESFRIIREATPYPAISFVGFAGSKLFTIVGVTSDNVSTLHYINWWIHSLLVFVGIAALPFTRLLHLVAGSLHLCTTRKTLGQLQPITLEELEATGKTGVEFIHEFTRTQLRSLDACVACGRCTEACPATAAGKPLSPMKVVQQLRKHLNNVGPPLVKSTGSEITPSPLHANVIKAESLWACTTCNACSDICPMGVSPVDFITDLRRFLIGNGELSGPPATALQKVQRTGNPWGLPAHERFNWAEGLDVPTVASNPDFEVLYWIGCSASYDRRIQKVARAVVQLLEHAGVNYATLGTEERCTGEFARRMGDEFLFQEQAQGNIETLDQHQVKTIITHCPHCLNSLSQDYPQFDGHYTIMHHTTFLNSLVESGKLNVPASRKTPSSITYHDPCYLARVCDETSAPRKLIDLSIGTHRLTEMPRSNRDSACCGAGGGRMWFDDTPDQRIGQDRVQEIMDTNAHTVAVACPFCLTMLQDGLQNKHAKTQVMDIAELLLAALGDSPA